MHENLETASRAVWKSRFGFLMAAAGCAIGVGNLWRFPYLVGTSGGGSFVLLYLLIIGVIGIPLLLTEITIGQYGRSDAYGSYVKVHPRIGSFGIISILGGLIMLSYYTTIGGWVLYYAARYFGAMWGGEPILSGMANSIFHQMISGPVTAVGWQLAFSLSVIVVAFFGLQKGTERANKIMMPMLFIMLLILAVLSFSLEGFKQGITFYLKPDLSKISLSVAAEALGQVFFSVGLGMAAMITYGSYLSPQMSSKRNSVLIPAMDTGIALLAGFIIFPAVFSVGMNPNSGAGLLFVTLAEVFAKLPAGNVLGFVFYLSAFFAAFSSAIALLESGVAYLVDQKKIPRTKSVLWLGLIIALIGIFPALSQGSGPLANVTINSLLGSPVWMANIKIFNLATFDLLDYITAQILLPLGGLATSIAGGWIMGKEKLLSMITDKGKRHFILGNVYFFLVKYVAPIAIIVIVLQSIIA